MKKLNAVLLVVFLSFSFMFPTSIALAYTQSRATESKYVNYRGSCVQLCRWLAPSFTVAATGSIDSLASKSSIINTQSACPGYIAIEAHSSWGHVAYVEKVSGSIITTLDGNWTGGQSSGGQVYRRTGTKAELGILGFWSPSEANKVYFYDLHNYWSGGWSTFKGIPFYAQYSSNLGFSNDQVSCIRINRANVTVQLYPDSNYRGLAITYKGIGVFQLPSSMDNKCSSYKIY